MTQVNYNLPALPSSMPEQDALRAANKLNEHRYLKLTNKQRVFVDAYLANGMDHSLAAREAGFSEEEATRAGKKLLNRPEIQQAIQYALQYYSEATKLRFEHLVEELKIIALTCITDLIDPTDAEIREGITPDDLRWRAVKSIKRTETKYGTNIEYTMHEKNSAIDKLWKLLAPAEAKAPSVVEQQTVTTTTNNVTNNVLAQITIVPVPSGQFLPPPPSPYQTDDDGLVIEHQSSPTLIDQIDVQNTSRASAPSEGVGR